jgi:prephenate dehydrogenase
MALMELGARAGLEFGGPGFREMTRLAGSPADIWEDILATNGDEIRAAAGDLGDGWGSLVEECLGPKPADAFRRSNILREQLLRLGRIPRA